MLQDYSCVMCGLQDHLFFQCPFAILCWQYLCLSWFPSVQGPLDFQETMNSLKSAIDRPFFMEIIMLIT
jgi:hypothetical protein